MERTSRDTVGPCGAKTYRIKTMSCRPAYGLIEVGRHHEIYLSDPRKTASEKLKTILRQPVISPE